MRGMNKSTGKAMSGHKHLQQRLADILGTPLGSRVRRRDYGSLLPRLVDHPIGPSLAIDLMHATAEAISRWEPEFRLTNAKLDFSTPGHVSINIFGTDLISGEQLRLEGIMV